MSEEADHKEPTTSGAPADKPAEKAAKPMPVGEVGEWRPSWFNFPKSVIVIILAPLIAYAAKYWIFEPTGEIGPSALWAAIGLACLSLPVYLAVSIVRKTTTLALFTDARIRHRSGIIARKSTEVMAMDIRSIDVTQTTMERILGIGKIEISTASRDDNEIAMAKVRNPEHIRAEINRFRDNDPTNNTND